MHRFPLLRAIVGLGVIAGFGVVFAVPASALTIPGSSPPATFAPLTTYPSEPGVCSGTDAAPGQLAGSYPTGVVIMGDCWVNGGIAQVTGNVNMQPGSTLNATFALNDQAGGVGQSALYVTGNINVSGGATLALGCEVNAAPCSDDPNAATGGTLTTLDIVAGNVLGAGPLGIIIHHSIITGSVEQLGGGGGVSCAPPTSGFFASMQSPVFSDLEDNWIVGNVAVGGLRTCWNGIFRNHVGGDLINIDNVYGDPGANVVLANAIGGDLSCAANSPVTQYGSGNYGVPPNTVGGTATGECAFSVLQPDPPGPPMPIAVPG